MLLWVVLACLTAIVLLVLLRPLAGAGAADRAPEAFDAAVYRDQLSEIESDRARGLIGEEEAEAARVEIARRLLAADSKARRVRPRQERRRQGQGGDDRRGAALPLLALGLYLIYGSPRLPDQPLAARLQDPASDRNLEALVARVEARLREHPEEGEGWEVIAPVYMGWRRYGDAAQAYAQAIRLLGPSAKRLSGQGQALVLANNGVVTEDARSALERALDARSNADRAAYPAGHRQGAGRAICRRPSRIGGRCLSKADGDAPWREMVEKRIAAAEAHLAGKPMNEAETPTPQAGAQSQNGPSASDIAAAQNMSPAERQAMVEQMVQGLAARLDQDGSDLAGWLKLVRAYSVLDRKDDALKALQRAKSQFSGNTQAIEQLDRAGGRAWIEVMTRKQRRGVLIGTCLAVLGLAIGLVLFAMRDSIVFFYSPSEVAAMQIAPGQRFRLGGLVETGSVVRGEGTTVRFVVTDRAKTLPVTYTGVLPDLFREGQGVVAEGTLEPDGVFHADNVLAKHDENYMPPEVAKKLKAQGVWRGDAEAGGAMSRGKVN